VKAKKGNYLRDVTANYSKRAYEDGVLEMKPIEFEAGEEREFYIELDFARRPNLPKDWSFVAHGRDGAVHVTHAKGIESDAWPHQKPK